MKLIVFINTPEIRVDIKPGVARECATMEEYFDYVRNEIRKSLTDPKNFRIPADQILRLARIYDKVKEDDETTD